MSTILIVDDHPVVRLGIRSLIESDETLTVCGETANRQETLDMLERHNPDLAIIDLLLRNEDGLELVKECAARFENLKMIVMTMQDERIYAERVLRAGADGFIAKEQAPDHILEAIHTVLAGEVYVSRATSARLLGHLLKGRNLNDNNPISNLTDRELHVFQLIGSGLGTKEIASKLGLSPKTIESHKEKIKTKMDLPDAEALREAAKRWVETGTL